jgi:hypothetical protein
MQSKRISASNSGSSQMKFNLKVIIVGGLVYYLMQWVVSFITGPLIHQGVLTEAYQANASFWRPELNQQPPDMAALMPRWIITGLITSLIAAAIYDNIRPAFNGSGAVKGMKFGFVAFLFYASTAAGWSGIFNLPDSIWAWWIFEGLFYFVPGGAALGWVAGKLAPELA